MKNVHYGRGDINVSGGGVGGELLLLAAAIAGGYFLITVIVHLLIMLAIALGAVFVTGLGCVAIWHFYVEPRLTRGRYRVRVLNGRERDYELDEHFPEPRAIENGQPLMTYEQWLRTVREVMGVRDDTED